MIKSSLAKRKKLRKRLVWLFQRDFFEGLIDTLSRSGFRNSINTHKKEVRA